MKEYDMHERRLPDISKILEKYPELDKYSGQELAWTISAIHSNNRAVGHFIEEARSGASTGALEYLNSFVGNMLAEIPKDEALTKFVADETDLHITPARKKIMKSTLSEARA